MKSEVGHKSIPTLIRKGQIQKIKKPELSSHPLRVWWQLRLFGISQSDPLLGSLSLLQINGLEEHQPGTQDRACVALCFLQRYFLWCMLTDMTVLHWAHLILIIPSVFTPMSNKRNLQQGHFIGTTSSISIVTPTFATSFAVKSHKTSYGCRIDKVTRICFSSLLFSRVEASLSFSVLNTRLSHRLILLLFKNRIV